MKDQINSIESECNIEHILTARKTSIAFKQFNILLCMSYSRNFISLATVQKAIQYTYVFIHRLSEKKNRIFTLETVVFAPFRYNW